MTRSVSLCYSLLTVCTTLQAGILITRTEKGIVFTDAAVISINGKDKALSLGAQTRIAGGTKMPSVKLGGTFFKDADSGVVGTFDQGAMSYLIPEGLKNPSGDASAIWKTAKISYRKGEKDKVATDVPPAQFVAFLPGGAEELTKICMDPAALGFLGGKSKVEAFQRELIGATAKSMASNPAVSPLSKYVEGVMAQAYQQFDSGTAGIEVLNRGLRFAELSATAYSSVPEQQKLRDSLKKQKNWVELKRAILYAFAGSEQWDAFLLGDREFEKYQTAFPDVADKHKQALRESLRIHQEAGKMRYTEGDYGGAVGEYRMAMLRSPGDTSLQDAYFRSWVGYSSRWAVDHKNDRPRLSAETQASISEKLQFAQRYMEQKRLTEALKSIDDATKIEPNHLDVLYRRAEILNAMNEVTSALKVLDRYDLLAVDEERGKSMTLRADMKFKIADLKKEVGDIKKAWDAANYNKANQLALQGLKIKDDDAELLYYAGQSALMLRASADGKRYLDKYLDVTNTLDGNIEQRVAVRKLISTIGAPSTRTTPDQGRPNWLSGKKLPEGVFYDPVSGAFQPKIERFDVGKLKVTFDWDGEKLRAINPTFEKNEHLSDEKKISFAYEDKVPQVIAAALDADAKPLATTDPDEAYLKSTLLVANNPYIDPIGVQKLTNKNITLGIAGNHYFLPFIWDKIHYFRLTYDDAGRIATAREIADPKGAPGDTLLEFAWEGNQLKSITGYSIAGDRRGQQVYQRRMNYSGNMLIGEEVQTSGKQVGHIKYNYNGSRLITAICDKEATLDNRQRTVAFR